MSGSYFFTRRVVLVDFFKKKFVTYQNENTLFPIIPLKEKVVQQKLSPNSCPSEFSNCSSFQELTDTFDSMSSEKATDCVIPKLKVHDHYTTCTFLDAKILFRSQPTSDF